MGLKSYLNSLGGGNVVEPSYDNFPRATNQRDQFFNLTTLLLHGDGTNTTQNNTFVDGSTNNFTITRNGNTTQGTIGPFGDNWSNFFDGNGDNLSFSLSSGGIGSGDFTLEYFVFHNTLSDYQSHFGVTRGSTGFNVGTDASGDFVWYDSNGGGSRKIEVIGAITTGRWYHWAFVRSGSTITGYLDGVSKGTYTSSVNYSGTTCTIGSLENNTEYMNGYISNFRIVKGTALYTSNFTPPTAPLTAVTNTVLLTCQSNRFRDNSTNNFTITRNGDVSVQKFTPFIPTSSYDPNVIGGSGYFDGSGDYLTIANNTAFNLSGTTYTIEGWINPNGDYSNYRTIISKRSGDTAATNAWQVYLRTSTGVLGFWNGTNYESSVTPAANAWNYFAAVFDGTNMNLYLNGSRVLQTAITNADTNATIYIGSYPTYSENFIGYISDLRITKGSALYSGTTMTVPTAPLTSSASTSLLLNFTNAAIRDNAGFNNLETVGNAQISTTQSKFGGSSLYFDGTGDYLVARATPPFTFAGDFTVEAWVYITSLATYHPILEGRTAATYSNYVFGIYNVSGTLRLDFVNAGGATGRTATTTSVPLNTWTHVAWVRSSGTTSYYVNGVKDSTTNSYSSSLAPASSTVLVGAVVDPYYFNGYIDDLRVTNGFARYTANFTPPSEPFYDL